MNCPYCNSKVVLRDSSVIYGRSFGQVYICSNYPNCNSYVGVENGRPKGMLADSELRQLRKQAHQLFDPLYTKMGYNKEEAYKAFGIRRIAAFNKTECRRFIHFIKNAYYNRS